MGDYKDGVAKAMTQKDLQRLSEIDIELQKSRGDVSGEAVRGKLFTPDALTVRDAPGKISLPEGESLSKVLSLVEERAFLAAQAEAQGVEIPEMGDTGDEYFDGLVKTLDRQSRDFYRARMGNGLPMDQPRGFSTLRQNYGETAKEYNAKAQD